MRKLRTGESYWLTLMQVTVNSQRARAWIHPQMRNQLVHALEQLAKERSEMRDKVKKIEALHKRATRLLNSK